MSASVGTMPMEITTYFLALAIFGGVSDYWTIVNMRRCIIMSSPDWLHIVNTSPAFWCDLMVSPTVGSACLLDYLARSGTRSLRIHLSFRLADLNRYISRTFNALSTTSLLDRRLSLIIDQAPRWVALRMETDRRSVLHFLRQRFREVDAPSMRRLSVVYFPEYHIGDFIAPVMAPVKWFKHTPDLDVLMLRSASMAWKTLAPLPFLRCLVLFTLPALYHPTFSEFKSLLECSPLLEYLALREVGCSDVLSVPLDSTITSRSIRTIDLDFNSDATMGLLSSFFRFPSLDRVALHIASASDILYARQCASLFASALYLEMSGGMVPTMPHTAVFAMLQALTCLDLTRAGISVFVQLVNLSSEHRLDGVTTIMPALETLVLGYELPRLIREFVVLHGAVDGSRGSHMTLRRLLTLFPSNISFASAADLLDRAWVGDHILYFKDCGPELINMESLEVRKWNVFPNVV